MSHFAHSSLVATYEPWDVGHALSDPNWVNVMHDKLESFERNQVWVLEPAPSNLSAFRDRGVPKPTSECRRVP
jgi:hypothetical protein